MKTRSSRASSRRTRSTDFIPRKLRSKLPCRRRRCQIDDPVLCFKRVCDVSVEVNSSSSAFSVDSSLCSFNGGDVKRKVKTDKKRSFGEFEDSQFRRITRSYRKLIENEKELERKSSGGCEVDVSGLSSVLSCRGDGDGAGTGERRSKLQKITKNGERFGIIEGSVAVTGQKVAKAEEFFGAGKIDRLPEFWRNEAVSVVSDVDSCSELKSRNQVVETSEVRDSGVLEVEFSEISRNQVDASFTVSNSESTIEQKTKSCGLISSDLACSEQFSYDEASNYSSERENAFSDLQWELFPENSDAEFSDYTPSQFLDSGSQFSEKSMEDSTPSPTFSLLLQYKEQFSRSTTSLNTKVSTQTDDGNTLLRFENEEVEESYQMLRSRERRQVYLRNYTEEYCSATEYGDLIIDQRLKMVHWIVEQSNAKELQNETMFLGVSLLDRFLSKGFFKYKRNLQIVGIACLTLATRIEENQPYNSARQKNFYIGSNVYSRFEVVAMEWLVQEVLSFQCFLPTIYNFLWYYLKVARVDVQVENRAKYLAVLVLSEHEQLCYWPSTVAACLVMLASLVSNQDANRRVMETHVRTEDDDLPECVQSLKWLLKYAC